jgi:hypothetical protein
MLRMLRNINRDFSSMIVSIGKIRQFFGGLNIKKTNKKNYDFSWIMFSFKFMTFIIKRTVLFNVGHFNIPL